MCRGLAGISGPSASIEQIDLAPRGRTLQKIRRGRAKGHIASIGVQRRRVAFFICRSAIGCRREKSCMRLAAYHGTFAGIPQKDLGAIVLYRGVNNKTSVET